MRTASAAVMVVLLLALPAVARAAELDEAPAAVAFGTGLAMMIAAAVLLVIALSLARVAEGSAVAQNISYVVGACACLAGSVLLSWMVRVLPDALSASQARLGSDLLIIAAIVLFSVYFWRVRASLRRFLTVVSSDEALGAAQGPPQDDTGHGGRETGGSGA